jgi:hypothetical protein
MAIIEPDGRAQNEPEAPDDDVIREMRHLFGF